MPLDRFAEAVLDLIRQSGRPPYETLSPAEARAFYRQARDVLAPPPPPVGEVRDLTIPHPAGIPLPARLYRPAMAEGALPLLAYFHGGGWVIGDLDTHDVVCRELANRAGIGVLSVDYRLAPEHRFPAAVEDAFTATKWAHAAAESLGFDPSRLAVGGDSAGGNLAAVVTLLARDQGGPPLAAQVLIYPATDLGMTHPSHQRWAEGYLLTRPTMEWFRGHYLSDPEREIADWRVSPLRAGDFRGLPPAFVLTAEYDPLVDEGEDYASRLAQAGVAVETHLMPGMIHGFLTMGKAIPAAATALGLIAAWLRARLA
jgi:acetyl esterase